MASGVATVTNGVLGPFDSSQLPDGPATLQLLVTNRNGFKAIATAESRVLNTQITFPQSSDLLPASVHVVRGNLVGATGYSLAYGRGLNPVTWTTLASGTASGLGIELGTWDAQELPEDFYTLRLASTNGTGVTEFTAPLIHIQPALKAGFPLSLPAGFEFPISDWRYVRPADLDGDGKSELVIIDPATRERPQRLLVYSVTGAHFRRRR